MKTITPNHITTYRNHLTETEKSKSTKEKYLRDISAFISWLGDRELTKDIILDYKAHLIKHHKPTSVNSIISALNSFFTFNNCLSYKTKALKIQRQIFADKDRELTKHEYKRLLAAAKANNNERLWLIMQTICSCGIRVSELEFITADAVKTNVAVINCKGKIRTVYMPKKLCKILKDYIKKKKISSGSVFVTRNGNPIDRSNIWSDMKKLCEKAGVSAAKVFPHNLRHLFARTYYSIQKDVVRLADILGHSSINTTRIYTMESGEVHSKQIQKLGLLLC
ncbi:MAG: tyrosine-type recombinase/integrase [Clostridia bacterium]|nr:tyrosine-type recombinase/integrase [Clostridia bacterium]